MPGVLAIQLGPGSRRGCHPARSRSARPSRFAQLRRNEDRRTYSPKAAGSTLSIGSLIVLRQEWRSPQPTNRRTARYRITELNIEEASIRTLGGRPWQRLLTGRCPGRGADPARRTAPVSASLTCGAPRRPGVWTTSAFCS